MARPLKRLLRQWRLRPDVLTVGSTGIWGSEAKSALKRSLRGIAPIIRTMSDVELAWDARLAERGSGVLLIAGTGAIAMAKRDGGPAVRSGGLGPLLGDEGSGFWIGREWLRSRPEREALALVRKPDVVRRVAQLARKAPSALFDRAAAHLVVLAERAATGAGLRSPVPLACHGGLFHEPRLQAAVAKRLRRSRLRWDLVPSVASPEIVAARLALAHRKFIVE